MGDLKKFGFRNLSNQNMTHLKQGFGVSVCNIVDELLNIELYRREFQFNSPQIPEDDPSDNEDNEELPEEESPEKIISTKKNSRLAF